MAVIGKGTTISYATTQNGSYTPVAEVLNIEPPGVKMGEVETTHLTSAAQDYEPTIPGDMQATFSCEFDPGESSHAAMHAAALAGTKYWWKVTYPDDGAADEIFNGFITELKPTGFENQKVITADITIRVKGVPALTP